MTQAWLLAQWNAQQKSTTTPRALPPASSTTSSPHPSAPPAAKPKPAASKPKKITARRVWQVYRTPAGEIRTKVIEGGKVIADYPGRKSPWQKTTAQAPQTTKRTLAALPGSSLASTISRTLPHILPAKATAMLAAAEEQARRKGAYAGLAQTPTGGTIKLGGIEYYVASTTPTNLPSVYKTSLKGPEGLTKTAYLKKTAGGYADVTKAYVTSQTNLPGQYTMISYSPEGKQRIARGSTPEEALEHHTQLYGEPGRVWLITPEGTFQEYRKQSPEEYTAVKRKPRIEIWATGSQDIVSALASPWGNIRSNYETIVPPEEQAYYYYHPEALARKYEIKTNIPNWQDYIRWQSSGEAAVSRLEHLDVPGAISAVSQMETVKAHYGLAGQALAGAQTGLTYSAEAALIGPAGVAANILGTTALTTKEITDTGKSVPEALKIQAKQAIDYAFRNPVEVGTAVAVAWAAAKLSKPTASIKTAQDITPTQSKITVAQTMPYKDVTIQTAKGTAYSTRHLITWQSTSTMLKNTGATSTGAYTIESVTPVYTSKWWGIAGAKARQALGKPSYHAHAITKGEYAYTWQQGKPYAKTLATENIKISIPGQELRRQLTITSKSMPPTPIKTTKIVSQETLATTPQGKTILTKYYGTHPTLSNVQAQTITTNKPITPENILPSKPPLKYRLLPEKYGVIAYPKKIKFRSPLALAPEETVKKTAGAKAPAKATAVTATEAKTVTKVFAPEVLNTVKAPAKATVTTVQPTIAITIPARTPEITLPARAQKILAPKTADLTTPKTTMAPLLGTKTKKKAEEMTEQFKASQQIIPRAKKKTLYSTASTLRTRRALAEATSTKSKPALEVVQATLVKEELLTAQEEQAAPENIVRPAPPVVPGAPGWPAISMGPAKKLFPVPVIPPVGLFGGGLFGLRTRRKHRKPRTTEYKPSMTSIQYNIFGKINLRKASKKLFKGIEIRPLPLAKPRKRKKTKKKRRKKKISLNKH